MESSLNDTYWDVAGDVGVYLGWGSGERMGDTPWSDEEFRIIQRHIKSGLRSFYFPVPIDGVQYEWSFLKPVATLTLAADSQHIELPDDFGGITSVITVSADGSTVYQPFPIRLMLEAAVRQQYAQLPTTSGRPVQMALIASEKPTIAKSNRQQLWVWPIADTAYTIEFQYQILPAMLSGSLPYAYGGALHAETILEACLAQAELKGDDQGDGPHAMKFRERLAASIAQDRKFKAQFVGYNGDHSDSLEGGWYGRRLWNVTPITYNGDPI